MSDALQNIVVLIGIILVAGVGWYMYSENQRMTLDTTPAAQLELEIQDFIQKQNTLRSISIDTSILSNPAFQALETVSDPVSSQPSGRPNPFIPRI